MIEIRMTPEQDAAMTRAHNERAAMFMAIGAWILGWFRLPKTSEASTRQAVPE